MNRLFLLFLLFSAQLVRGQALIEAIKVNNLELAKKLIKQGENLNQTDSNGATPLMWAVLKSDLNFCKFLVKKGYIFKTYEGELIMSSIQSTSSTTLASEKFFFSVKSDSLANSMFDFEGKHIVVHYEQKRSHLPWNGETDYIVTSVKVDE